jgi:lambda family phage portal protein
MPKKFEPDEKMNDALEENWKVWSDGCDPAGKAHFYELQSLLMREYFVAGEALLVFSEATDERKIPLTAEVIPSERLSMKDNTTISGKVLPGNKIIQGIEYDSNSAIAAYYIYPNHPWDSVYGSDKEVRVDAKRVIHFFDPLEPGSVRGLTRFLCVAGALEGFMQWLDFLLTKERIAGAFALAFLQNLGLGLNSPVSTGDATDEEDESGNKIDILEGGIIAHLNAGEDIKGVQSGVQGAQVDPLSRVFLRVVARGLDVSYETVARDLSNVTYLSARQGENQDRRHWEPQQERMNRRVNTPVWREVQKTAHMKGMLPVRGELLPRHMEVDFVRPGWPWIDPSKDIQGDILAIGAGLQSPLETVISKGGDPYKVLRDIEQFKKYMKEMKLEDSLTLFQPKPEPVAAAKPAAEKPEENNGNENKEAKPAAGKSEADAA